VPIAETQGRRRFVGDIEEWHELAQLLRLEGELLFEGEAEEESDWKRHPPSSRVCTATFLQTTSIRRAKARGDSSRSRIGESESSVSSPFSEQETSESRATACLANSRPTSAVGKASESRALQGSDSELAVLERCGRPAGEERGCASLGWPEPEEC